MKENKDDAIHNLEVIQKLHNIRKMLLEIKEEMDH
jgi:hypothetical protein